MIAGLLVFLLVAWVEAVSVALASSAVFLIDDVGNASLSPQNAGKDG
jgi:hypothetical protein